MVHSCGYSTTTLYSTGLLSYNKTACKFATGRVAIAIVPRVLHYSASLCIVSCKLLNICIVWILPKTFRSGDMALFVDHDD